MMIRVLTLMRGLLPISVKLDAGLSGQNLVSRDIDTKDIYITNGMTEKPPTPKIHTKSAPGATASGHRNGITIC